MQGCGDGSQVEEAGCANKVGHDCRRLLDRVGARFSSPHKMAVSSCAWRATVGDVRSAVGIHGAFKQSLIVLGYKQCQGLRGPAHSTFLQTHQPSPAPN